MAQFLPADHTRGDANTIGGYAEVHGRPAAFEGSDGMSYSVALLAEATGDAARPWTAWFCFLRWRRMGDPGVEGHLETEPLAWGRSEAEALATLGAFSLGEVRDELEGCLAAERRSAVPERRWWDVMRDEDA
ncbi:MAG: hypothetical protein MUF53_05560 [Gemmatimonadaceae bacterium]|jgi:hypothetical protein|nr:hypothetical protein [Gemmatimonadaceae bacterium]